MSRVAAVVMLSGSVTQFFTMVAAPVCRHLKKRNESATNILCLWWLSAVSPPLHRQQDAASPAWIHSVKYAVFLNSAVRLRPDCLFTFFSSSLLKNKSGPETCSSIADVLTSPPLPLPPPPPPPSPAALCRAVLFERFPLLIMTAAV